MEGAAKATERHHDDNVRLAYMAGVFGASCAGKLKKRVEPEAFLIEKPERKPQSPEEMLGVFRRFQAMGAPMNIRQVN